MKSILDAGQKEWQITESPTNWVFFDYSFNISYIPKNSMTLAEATFYFLEELAERVN